MCLGTKDTESHLCVHRVSSREDRAPPEHAGQPRGQSHTRHGRHVGRRHAVPRHREYCEFAPFFDVRRMNIAVKLAGSAFMHELLTSTCPLYPHLKQLLQQVNDLDHSRKHGPNYIFNDLKVKKKKKKRSRECVERSKEGVAASSSLSHDLFLCLLKPPALPPPAGHQRERSRSALTSPHPEKGMIA